MVLSWCLLKMPCDASILVCVLSVDSQDHDKVSVEGTYLSYCCHVIGGNWLAWIPLCM